MNQTDNPPGQGDPSQPPNTDPPDRPRLPEIPGSDDDEEFFGSSDGVAQGILTDFRDPLSGDVLETNADPTDDSLF
jgi:hypothetical protein